MLNRIKNYYDKKMHSRSNTITIEQRPNSFSLLSNQS
jgi:hypothetical protein